MKNWWRRWVLSHAVTTELIFFVPRYEFLMKKRFQQIYIILQVSKESIMSKILYGVVIFFLTKSFEVCWRIKIFACKLSSLFCQLQVVTLWWQVEKVRVHKVHGIINLLLRLRWQTDNQLSRSNPHLTARDNTISCCVVLVIRQSELQPW